MQSNGLPVMRRTQGKQRASSARVQYPSPTPDFCAQARLRTNQMRALRWLQRCKQEPLNQGSRFCHLGHDPIFIYTFVLKRSNKFNLLRRASDSRPGLMPSPLLDYKLSEGGFLNGIGQTFPKKEISCMQTKYNKFKMHTKRFALFKIQQPQNNKIK